MSPDVLFLEDMCDPRRVKVGRAVKGWTQAECAVYASVPQSMVSFIERGFRIPKDRRRAIFQVLGLNPDEDTL